MTTTPVPPEMKRLAPFEKTLREAARAYPETTEDFPWGHPTVKVKGKAFVFFSLSAEGLSLSVKLPHSHEAALMLPFAQPTGYGLGKSGWVSARFGAKDTPPLELLRQWLDESYRAVAPKKLVAGLDGGGTPSARKPPAAKKPLAAKKAARRSPRS
ncbi:MmcQ/YjbR family DNA-binding protein [Archangium primigenium]|uniref:MmcQ/YjbR family DNA-binding protein n=1 Tax=[Archangium] primigenium TaxID=2792470 RepID=UPI001958B5CC|nr:MmcQ/YjbR family DNA-binding protein [Archangium primigenium]MBM7117823.1 MmcQ/YjbR family DNA-binding protein [Archangium primigenium]